MAETVPSLTSKGDRPARTRILGVAVFVLVFALLTGGALVLRQVVRQPGDMGGIPGNSFAGTKPTGRGASLDKLLEDANIAMGQQEYLRAESILARAVESFPEEQRAHLQYAQALVTRKKFRDAYAQYAAAIALTPAPEGTVNAAVGDPKRQFEAGTVANEAGLVERAEEHYAMAQGADPAEPRYPLYLAMVQIKLGKDSAAMVALVRATKLNPDLAVAWG